MVDIPKDSTKLLELVHLLCDRNKKKKIFPTLKPGTLKVYLCLILTHFCFDTQPNQETIAAGKIRQKFKIAALWYVCFGQNKGIS